MQLTFVDPLTVTTADLPDAVAGSPYATGINATGGAGPYAFAVTSGALPPGVGLDGTSGALTGVPTAAGTYDFEVKVVDSGRPR